MNSLLPDTTTPMPYYIPIAQRLILDEVLLSGRALNEAIAWAAFYERMEHSPHVSDAGAKLHEAHYQARHHTDNLKRLYVALQEAREAAANRAVGPTGKPEPPRYAALQRRLQCRI